MRHKPYSTWGRHLRQVLLLKLVLHVICVSLTTYIVLDTSFRSNEYALATADNLCHFFFPPNCLGSSGGCRDPTTFDDDRFCHIYRKNETYSAVTRAIHSYYYSLRNESVASYRPLLGGPPPQSYVPPVLTATTYVEGSSPQRKRVATYDLFPGDAGPVDVSRRSGAELRSFYSSLVEFRVSFQVEDTLPRSSYSRMNENSCYLWNVSLVYSDENESKLKVYVESDVVGRCGGASEAESPSSVSGRANLATMGVTATFILVLLADFFDDIRNLVLCRRIVAQSEFKDRLGANMRAMINAGSVGDPFTFFFWIKFIDVWNIIMMGAGACSFASSLAHFFGFTIFDPQSDLGLTGLGCGLYWATLVRYMSNSRRLYAIVLILRRSIPQVLRIIIGASPVFVAYAFMAMSVFGPTSTRFASLGGSIVTLFSLMSGDIILETLDIVRTNFPSLGPIFLLSFTFIFTYFCLNVILTVVEESLWLVNAETAAVRNSNSMDLGRLTTSGSGSASARRVNVDASGATSASAAAAAASPGPGVGGDSSGLYQSVGTPTTRPRASSSLPKRKSSGGGASVSLAGKRSLSTSRVSFSRQSLAELREEEDNANVQGEGRVDDDDCGGDDDDDDDVDAQDLTLDDLFFGLLSVGVASETAKLKRERRAAKMEAAKGGKKSADSKVARRNQSKDRDESGYYAMSAGNLDSSVENMHTNIRPHSRTTTGTTNDELKNNMAPPSSKKTKRKTWCRRNWQRVVVGCLATICVGIFSLLMFGYLEILKEHGR